MESTEEVVNFVARPDSRIPLPKRKRTKRLRGQSPLTFPIASSPREEKVSKTDPNFSPACSSDVTRGDETNEEEDMAHCLILLARGQLDEHEKRQLSMEEHDGEEDHMNKFNSKRFLETGEYAYQCKTCDRSFPSFQALGGHRASHKKPKITPRPMAEDNNRQIPTSLLSPASVSDDEDVLSLQLMNTTKNSSCANTRINSGKQFAKIHECSICGAEFSTGQALGGHMRRHRAIMTGPAPASASAMVLTPKTPESEEPLRLRSYKAPSLELDLNLPAPEDDDPEPRFPINSRGQQQRDRPSLVFSFPALVGCHY